MLTIWLHIFCSSSNSLVSTQQYSLIMSSFSKDSVFSLSEPEVFPVYDEEAELELDSASTATDDRSPAMLHTQDSDDLSLNDSYNRSNSVEDSPGSFPVTAPGNGPRDNGKEASDTQQKNEVFCVF